MVLFNYSTRELTAKIVYYGPGLCGKTTNLQYIHENLPGDVRGKMLSLATKTDRTLFFDFLPIDLGEIRGMKTRVQLYTVPGQVFYNETRKLVLKGADGIVFVADSQDTMLGANVEAFKNLEENLKAHGMKLAEMPHVIQFNKRDLPKLSPIEDLNAALNKFNAPFYESVATTGIGVQDTLKAIVKLVLLHLTKKYDPKSVPASAQRGAAASPAVLPVVPAAAAPPAPAAVPVAASAGRSVAAARAAAPAPSFEAAESAIPLSPIDEPDGAPSDRTPPLPRSRASAGTRGRENFPAFGDDEIEGLVDEVEEIESAPVAAVEPRPAPVSKPAIPAASFAAPPAPADPDEGTWMGDADEGSASGIPHAAFGGTTSLEDLLAAEAERSSQPGPDPVREAPPWSAVTPPPGSQFEVDRGFDPDWTSVPEAPPAESAPPRAPAARAPRAAQPQAEVPAALPVSRFEEPEPEAETAPAHAAAPSALPAEPLEPRHDDLLLTEVAHDDDLFSDPDVEIAHLANGEAREIVVPVMLGEGASAKRYKLSIRLRLDDAD